MIELQSNEQRCNSFERIEPMKLTHDVLSLRGSRVTVDAVHILSNRIFLIL